MSGHDIRRQDRLQALAARFILAVQADDTDAIERILAEHGDTIRHARPLAIALAHWAGKHLDDLGPDTVTDMAAEALDRLAEGGDQ
ncbi:hypothetical protein GPOL_c25760 [Gordonia polyisoprenivorans VH2]|uniref:Uncharacterized protein n=1 Tax=Gordonia polyisoprenivorans (strain DSM 44266 / VH2) TaxID=1112204 RepID=H6N4M1_GORPV|nr:hypothetical protein [Gordonia polyisoprenivorans]AFA73603.1 hypothetical protein GPOL_c25760 [Gordonia polyisoprenivorans VH2]